MATGPSYFDGLPKTSFSGIEFPAERIVLHSQGRQHIHEFPKAPAGAPEKLGRGLWHLTVTGNFTGGAKNFKSYPGLYPGRLNALRALYEAQTTATFVYPPYGSFQAFIIGWKEEYVPGKYRSGVKVDLEVLEDQRTAFLVQTQQATDVATQQANLDAQLQNIQGALKLPSTTTSIFDAIRATVNAVLAFGDQAQLYTALYAGKIQQLIDLCTTADQDINLHGPIAVGIVDSLHDVWLSAVTLSQQVRSQNPLSQWTVESTTTLTDLAATIYGDTSRQGDLLTLNAGAISDPNRIRAGTTLLYYPPS